MSIQSEINRLESAKADIKTAIESKGVTVPESTTLEAYGALVGQIQAGGGGESIEYINFSVNLSNITADFIIKNSELDALEPIHKSDQIISGEFVSPKNSIIKLDCSNINVNESVGLTLVKQEGTQISYYKIVGDGNSSATLKANGGNSGGGILSVISDTEALRIITGGDSI